MTSTQHARFEQRQADLAADRRRRWAWGSGAVAVLAAGVYVVGFSPLLAVQDVDVVGAEPGDTAAIGEIAAGAHGRPLARVDVGAIVDGAEARPGVESATVVRDWPRTLRVEVVPRIPALAVNRGKGQVEVYDIDGVRIRSTGSVPKGVPTISADRGAEVSGHGVTAALSMLEALPQGVRDRVSAVTVDAADRVSFRIGRTTVVWGDEAQPQLKVQVIDVLLKGRPKVLDVSAPDTPVTR